MNKVHFSVKQMSEKNKKACHTFTEAESDIFIAPNPKDWSMSLDSFSFNWLIDYSDHYLISTNGTRSELYLLVPHLQTGIWWQSQAVEILNSRTDD